MAACTDGFDTLFPDISVLQFGLCASELSAISSVKFILNKNLLAVIFSLTKEPVARSLFTSRCIVEFDRNKSPRSKIVNFLRHILNVSLLTHVPTVKTPQYCSALIPINTDKKTLHVTLYFVLTNDKEQFRSDGRSLSNELCDRPFQATQ